MTNPADAISIPIEELENTMAEKLKLHPPWDSTCCIFRVHQLLRRHNPEAYQPNFVSIGPLHHRDGQRFQLMDNVKQWYLHILLSRRNMSLKTLIDKAIEFEQKARSFYAEPLDNFDSNEFIEMLIVDGCFIIELFRKRKYKKQIHKDDPSFNMNCMFQYICHDLLLLENQLPWFVLTDLYTLTMENDEQGITFKQLMLTGFTTQPPLRHNCKSYLEYLAANRDNGDDKTLHTLDLIRTTIVFSFIDQSDHHVFNSSRTQLMHSATALSEAGIKFRVVDEDITANRDLKVSSIMNIKFEDGVLTIPRLEIGEITASMFRNLIAFEQYHPDRPDQIASYAYLMDNLIGSSKDMEFLCTKKIIGNWLSPEDGSKFFSKLHNDTSLKTFCYSGLCKRLNKHYDTKWNTWLEKLKRDYFVNPWTVIALIAATIVLILSALQTSYTILQYNSPLQ